LTTKRYSDTDVEVIARDPKYITRYLKLKDRFGDNGLISVLFGKLHDGEFIIDTWLMSCRVLKRGAEDFLFNETLRAVHHAGAKLIRGSYLPTPKNGLVANLLADIGFTKVSSSNDGASDWTLDLGDIEKLEGRKSFIRRVPPD